MYIKRRKQASNVDADGHQCTPYNLVGASGQGTCPSCESQCNNPSGCSLIAQNNPNPKPPGENKAKQTYGRQPDGSYKADPSDVQAAIEAGKPILEPGNPDHKSECVFACKALSHMKNVGTSQWRKEKAAVDLNDTTDIGLAIATLGSGDVHPNMGTPEFTWA